MHALGREKIAESFGEKLSLTAEMVRTGRMGAAHDVAYGDMGMGWGRARVGWGGKGGSGVPNGVFPVGATDSLTRS